MQDFKWSLDFSRNEGENVEKQVKRKITNCVKNYEGNYGMTYKLGKIKGIEKAGE